MIPVSGRLPKALKYLSEPSGRIDAVSMGMSSPSELISQSAMRVTEDKPTQTGIPRPFSVDDPRSGTNDRRYNCSTCGKTTNHCNGHLGHVILPLPVYHPLYIHHERAVLESVCWNCCRLKADPEKDAALKKAVSHSNPEFRYTAVTTLLKSRNRCQHCDFSQPDYGITAPPLSIVRTWSSAAQKSILSSEWADVWEREALDGPFYPADAHCILKNIPDDDLKCLGIDPTLTRPEYGILFVLAVPPPCIRPVVSRSEGSNAKGQDPLTQSLNRIVRCSQQGFEEISSFLGRGKTPASDLRKQIMEAHRARVSRRKKNQTDAQIPAKLARAEAIGKFVHSLKCYEESRVRDKADVKVPEIPEELVHSMGLSENFLTFGDLLGDTVVRVVFDDDAQDWQKLSSDCSNPESSVRLSRAIPSIVTKLQSAMYKYFVDPGKATKTITQASSRPQTKDQTLPQRYTGKGNRFRLSMLGKRLDRTARTVVTPSVDQDADSLGIPKRVAVELSVPQIVFDGNLKDSKARVRLGHGVLGGADMVMSPSGESFYLEGKTKVERHALADQVSVGWLVERHLKKGDWVLFNRQPTLHKMSINAHKVYIHDGNTFIVSGVVCESYNADFDGDEMQMIALGGGYSGAFAERAEMMEMSHIGQQARAPQTNRLSYCIALEAMLGACILSLEDTTLSNESFFDLLSTIKYPFNGVRSKTLSWVKDWPTIKTSDCFTGRQLLSMLLPPNINYTK